MPWWAWVLVVAGAIAMGVIKVTVYNRWMERRRALRKRAEE